MSRSMHCESMRRLGRCDAFALSARVAEMEAEYDQFRDAYGLMLAQVEKAEADNKRLREELAWLMDEFETRDDEYGAVLFTRNDFNKVRAALAGKEE